MSASKAQESGTAYVIDREAVEAEVARMRAHLARGKGRWFVRHFALAAAVFYGIAAVSQWGRVREMPSEQLLLILLFPAAGAALVSWWLIRQTFGNRALDASSRAEDIARQLRDYGGAGWVRRSLLNGLALGLAIGLPVGVFMQFAWPVQDLPTRRWLVTPFFIGVTLLWTLPAAFLWRRFSLLSLRRFVKEVPQSSSPSPAEMVRGGPSST